MVVAVCTDSEENYGAISSAVKSYGEQKKYLLVPRKFSGEGYLKEQKSYWYPITIFALDDVMNQELSICARGLSEASQFIWIGQDKRFGMAAYRIGIAYAILEPASEKELFTGLDRCFIRLERSGIVPAWEERKGGCKEWIIPDRPEHIVGRR